jgi:glutamine synthetase
MADNVMVYKYVVKNVAHQRGMTATFMPKPLFGDNGSGMHVHQSIWRGQQPVFAGDGYAGSSELMRYYIGGLLKHAPALLAICAPTVNSYRRLVPGFEAPVNLGYSQRNRSAAVRIPMYSANPKTKRVEFRCPDPACNPYLAFAAMLMAGLDGIQNRITKICTTCRRSSEPKFSQPLDRSMRRLMRSKPTINFCSRARCSQKMRWKST